MKTLNEIKEEVAKEEGYEYWSYLYHDFADGKFGMAYIAQIYESFAYRFAEQALEEAAERVNWREMTKDEWGSGNIDGLQNNMGDIYIISPESILSIKEQLK